MEQFPYPAVEIVALERTDLTDRIAKELFRRFATYNAGPSTSIVGKQDEYEDGYRGVLVWAQNGKDRILAQVRGAEPLPPEALGIDVAAYTQVLCEARFASLYLSVNPNNPSISREFPLRVASLVMDPIADSVEGIVWAACPFPMHVVDLDGLKLTPDQMDQFRVVPYVQGPQSVSFNHFRYDAFRKMGAKDLAKAFLYAHGRV